MYTSFAISQQGESHIKANNKPCEDASGNFPVELNYDGQTYQTALAVVSDGHGGEKYFRSRFGSELAVVATHEEIIKFIQNAAERKVAFFNEEEKKNKSTMNQHMIGLEKRIITNWREQVVNHVEKNEWTTEEIEFCSQHQLKIPAKEDTVRLLSAYGTTLLATFVSEMFWFTLQIGDGAAVIIPENFNAQIAVDTDTEQGFGVTKSLCNTDAISSFRHNYGFDSLLGATVASDGIEDSFTKEQFIAFNLGNLLKNFVETPVEAEKQLTEYMPELSKKGSQDDVSIAGIFNIEAARQALPYLDVILGHSRENQRLAKEVTQLTTQIANDSYRTGQEIEALNKKIVNTERNLQSEKTEHDKTKQELATEKTGRRKAEDNYQAEQASHAKTNLELTQIRADYTAVKAVYDAVMDAVSRFQTDVTAAIKTSPKTHNGLLGLFKK
jgi:hypothetical protein